MVCPEKRSKYRRHVATAACFVATLGTMVTATPPMITGMPAVSAPVLVADNATEYTVTMSASDPDGYNDLRELRVLFNYDESAVQTKGRGYLAWAQADGDITRYGGTWVTADATGGGRWAYRSDAWGGTTYMTPLGCAMATFGSPSGAPGGRTVMWTFRVKPAWASNPVINDADAFTADYASSVGWMENSAEFDVLPAGCTMSAATPRAPVVTGPTGTTLNVAIDPADSAIDVFAIRIAPEMNGRPYVQADGSLGQTAVWQTKAQWATTSVTGLLWDATYSFSARATRFTAGFCPSGYGAAAAGTTLNLVPRVPRAAGRPLSPAVRGQCPYRSIPDPGIQTVWDCGRNASGRGLAGGLDADTYDWRDLNSGANWGLVGGHFSTLQFLQFARDNGASPLLTANAFGGGAKDDTGTFVCQTVNPEGLAADWVRYTNIILQNYRIGDEASLTGDDLRVFNSISNWLGRPKLLSPGEPATPPVIWWEIGNEPELGAINTFLSNHYLSPTDYRDRYRSISQAMLAVDPTLKIGPCLINPSDPTGSGQWLAALAADPATPVDFVAYHPYYSEIKNAWGNPPGITSALRRMKAYLNARSAGIRALMAQHGRAGYELMATEWNPVNWDAGGQTQRSVANALGVVETVFTFADDDVFAGHFWEHPQSKPAVTHMFLELADHMGDELLLTPESMGLVSGHLNWRIYASRHAAAPDTVFVWGLNFNEDDVVEVDLALSPCMVQSAILRRYGRPGDDASGGDTSLMHSSGMAWEQQDITADFNDRGFRFRMEDAEVTLLIATVTPVPPADFDRDGDVDQADFGAFQTCYSGSGHPQNSSECVDARLDGDKDVDQADFVRFLQCMGGANVIAHANCHE